MSDEFFSGWGVRTIPTSEARYNPMSYHNGSIWPHDNALIAYGLARYGFKDAATRILSALFDASQFMELNRLPELYCGFERQAKAPRFTRWHATLRPGHPPRFSLCSRPFLARVSRRPPTGFT